MPAICVIVSDFVPAAVGISRRLACFYCMRLFGVDDEMLKLATKVYPVLKMISIWYLPYLNVSNLRYIRRAQIVERTWILSSVGCQKPSFMLLSRQSWMVIPGLLMISLSEIMTGFARSLSRALL